MTGPCKKCADRSVGCHADCVKYIEYRAKLDEAKGREEKDRLPKLFLFESVRKAKIKTQRKTKISGGIREQ